MLKPLSNRILVKLLPRYAEAESKLNLVLVDKKKHYEGVRRGIVKYIGRVHPEIRVGDIIWVSGDLGESFSLDENGANDGTDWRRLKASQILAVEDRGVEDPSGSEEAV